MILPKSRTDCFINSFSDGISKLRYIIIYITLTLAFVACTKPIVLKDIGLNKDGMFTYGFDSTKSFFINKNISPDIRIKWIAETDGSFSDVSVVAYDEYIFAGDLSGNIFCFSDTSGKKLGVLKHKGEINTSPVIQKDKLIYVVNNYKEKYATLVYYQFIQGRLHKEIELAGNYPNEIAVVPDGILLLSQQGEISKYNLIGELDWKLDTGILTFSNPVVNKGRLYFAGVYGEIVTVNLTTRKIMNTEMIGDSFESSPVIIGGSMFIADTYGILYRIDLKDGSIIWEKETGYKVVNQPVYDNEKNIYVGNLGGVVCSYTFDGEDRWIYDTGGIVNSVPLVFNNLLIQPDMNRKLHIIDSNNGKLLNELNYDRRVRTTPGYYNGKVYVGIDRNEIYAYEVDEL